jgi:hypothetical protein
MKIVTSVWCASTGSNKKLFSTMKSGRQLGATTNNSRKLGAATLGEEVLKT